MNYILGVSGYFHDSSVCLLRDGKLIEFVKEESLTRIKGTRGFPSRSLNFLINKYNLTDDNINYLAFYEKPLRGWATNIHFSLAKPKISFVVLRGRTESDRNVYIAAETTGIVENIYFEKGDKVKKGEIICKQSIDARKAKLDEANALMKQKELEWQASKTLVEKGYRSQTQLAASSAAYDASKALVKQMEQELDNINIRAPFDGIFNEKLAEIGDFLSIGKPCGKVVDYDPIKITAQVSEKEILSVKNGLPGRAKLSTGEKVEGLVTYVSNTADPATRTFRIEMEVENNNLSYKDGLTAEIFIPIKEINGHLIPPSSLTLNEVGEVGVRHIVDKNKAKFSKVEILGDENELVWISGLPEKVTIITVGHEFVSNGDSVNYRLQDENS